MPNRNYKQLCWSRGPEIEVLRGWKGGEGETLRGQHGRPLVTDLHCVAST